MKDYLALSTVYQRHEPLLSEQDQRLISEASQALQQLMLQDTVDALHLATALCMHHATLRRRIHSAIGMTTGEYIALMRCQHILAMLDKHPSVRIADIISVCGFADHAHFCHFFRRYFHCSSTEYLRHKHIYTNLK